MNLFSRLKRQFAAKRGIIVGHGDPPQSSAFESLLPKNSELRNELGEFIMQINNMGGSYHQLNFGKGMMIDGEFNMSQYIDRYGISDDLTGA